MSVLPPGSRRRVGTLAASQLVGGIGMASGLAVGALLAESITGRAALSGLPQTANVLGAALLAVPLARLAGRAGRRTALLAGFAIAALGGATALVAAMIGSFPLLIVGTAMAGGGSAAGFQARFAATDGVEPSGHGRVLALVVWTTTVGAILGPNLIERGANLAERLSIPDLAGPWIIATVALFAAALVIAFGLKRDRPIDAPPKAAPIADVVRSIAQHPEGLIGIVSIATGHVVMVGIMAMTAVHLNGNGSSLQIVGLVISVHVAGMFALSPFFGWAADKWGPIRVIVGGAITLMGGALLTAAGGVLDDAFRHAEAERVVGIGLLLIGLGWSAGLIAGSTMVARASHAEDAGVTPTDIQGASDLVMGLAGAIAGGLSGVVLSAIGYSGLSIAGALLVIPLLVLLATRGRAILQQVA